MGSDEDYLKVAQDSVFEMILGSDVSIRSYK